MVYEHPFYSTSWTEMNESLLEFSPKNVLDIQLKCGCEATSNCATYLYKK
jgi:hypothetical protein